MNAKLLALKLIAAGRKQLPAVLTAGAMASLVTTIVLAFDEAPKAKDVLDAAKEELKRENITPEEAKTIKRDAAKEIGKIVWPVALSAVLTGGFILGSHSVSVKRQAVVTAACTAAESALADYQGKVKDIFGKKKEQEVRDAINVDKLEANPASKNYIIMTGKGDYTCYDAYTGRYFKSSIDKVKEAINNLNHQMTMGSEPYCSLNDFYDEIGLPEVPGGEDVGWKTTEGLIELSETYSKDDLGDPCLVIDFLKRPLPFYKSLY